MMASALAVSALAWLPCHRLIASRFPTVGLYDQVAAPEDLDVVFAIEALTNPRVRQELGQLSLVPPADREMCIRDSCCPWCCGGCWWPCRCRCR